jgi:hypothetical protein
MAGVNYSIRFAGKRGTSGNAAWLSIDELAPPGKSSRERRPIPGVDLVPGRRLNGDEASYRVNLGPKPRILLGKAYRFQ